MVGFDGFLLFFLFEVVVLMDFTFFFCANVLMDFTGAVVLLLEIIRHEKMVT